MGRFVRVAGVLVEPVGLLWAAFSPATGETALLNDESASILEVLEIEPADTTAVCAVLSSDSGIAPDELFALVDGSWQQLTDAGLVRELPVTRNHPQ